jgi:hypothetical protein
MTDQGLRMDSLTIETPHADRLTELLDALGLTDRPEIITALQTKLDVQFSKVPIL